MSKKPIVVIDFGTSKILVLVAEEAAYQQKVTITSAGMAQYDGFMNGEWNSPQDVNDAIASAIEAAEKKSGTRIRDVYIGVPGEYMDVYIMDSTVSLQGADPKVTSEDVENLLRNATAELHHPTGVILHRAPAWFKIDGGQKTLEPVDQKGSTLEGLVGFIVAQQFFVTDVIARLQELGLHVKGTYSSSVGEALQLVPFEERDRTAILIDVGYLSTEVMAMEGDTLIWHYIVPVGGAHIVMDLTYGLERPFELCERVKRAYEFNKSKNATIEIQGEDGMTESFSGERVSEIIDARVDEILELCEEAIEHSGVHLGNWSNVYITGGGIITMKGARLYVAEKMKKYNVREAAVRTTKMKPPHIYSSGSGLVEFVYNMNEMQEQDETFFDKMKRKLSRKK